MERLTESVRLLASLDGEVMARRHGCAQLAPLCARRSGHPVSPRGPRAGGVRKKPFVSYARREMPLRGVSSRGRSFRPTAPLLPSPSSRHPLWRHPISRPSFLHNRNRRSCFLGPARCGEQSGARFSRALPVLKRKLSPVRYKVLHQTRGLRWTI